MALKQLTLSTLLLISPLLTFAKTTKWQIIPDKSKLSFIATQNGAPIRGQFKQFNGDVFFDPNDLAKSHVKILIDLQSVTTPYSDLTSTLKTSDWFHTKKYPEATFEAAKFKKIGDGQYQASGTLNIRNTSAPIVVTFKGIDFSKPETTVEGTASLKRSAFGVGQGEWASTDEIKDDVKVSFNLLAKKSP